MSDDTVNHLAYLLGEREEATAQRERNDKANFMEKYILNRALAHRGGLEAETALQEAEIAWALLIRVRKFGKL